MGLIVCGECKSQISDRAAACVKCGAPLAPLVPPPGGPSPVAAPPAPGFVSRTSKSLAQGCLVIVLFAVLFFASRSWKTWRQGRQAEAASSALAERRFEDAARLADEALQAGPDVRAQEVRDQAQAGLAGVEGMAALGRGESKAAYEGLSRAARAGQADAEMTAAFDKARSSYGAQLRAEAVELAKAEKWRDAVGAFGRANAIHETPEGTAALLRAKEKLITALLAKGLDLANSHQKWREAIAVFSEANAVHETPQGLSALAQAKERLADSLFLQAADLLKANKLREALALMVEANETHANPKAEPFIAQLRGQIAAQDYDEAEAALAKGDHEMARVLFGRAGDHRDAKARRAEIETRLAQQAAQDAFAARKESARRNGDTPSQGEQGWIFAPTPGERVHVGASAESYREAMKASLNHDEHGFRELAGAGLVFTVPDGTRVLMLEFGTLSRVRILEGLHEGEAAFLPYEWVKK